MHFKENRAICEYWLINIVILSIICKFYKKIVSLRYFSCKYHSMTSTLLVLLFGPLPFNKKLFLGYPYQLEPKEEGKFIIKNGVSFNKVTEMYSEWLTGHHH